MEKNTFNRTGKKHLKDVEMLEQVLNNAQVAIAITDSNLKIERINPEFTLIFGYTAEEATGNFIYNLIIPEELRDEWDRLIGNWRRGNESNSRQYAVGRMDD